MTGKGYNRQTCKKAGDKKDAQAGRQYSKEP